MTRDIRSRVLGDQRCPHLVVAFARRRVPFMKNNPRPGAVWGHTALWDEEKGVFNEALMFKGVVETPQNEWFENWSTTQLIAVPCPKPDRGLSWARGHAAVNTPYDYRGAWSVLPRGDWQDQNRLYCSEKETLALVEAELVLFADPMRGVHPHELWRVVAVLANLGEPNGNHQH